MTPEEIISDEEINRVHANANFGAMDKRDVVNEAILKAACKFHNGYTAQTIITEHGLVKHKTNSRPPLTEKGRKYLWAVFNKGNSQ